MDSAGLALHHHSRLKSAAHVLCNNLSKRENTSLQRTEGGRAHEERCVQESRRDKDEWWAANLRKTERDEEKQEGLWWDDGGRKVAWRTGGKVGKTCRRERWRSRGEWCNKRERGWIKSERNWRRRSRRQEERHIYKLRDEEDKEGDKGWARGETDRERDYECVWQREERESEGGSPADLVWRGNCIAKDLLLQV